MTVGVVGGVALLVAFDTTFEIFHRLFFKPGSFTFDPRTERLVQIFPEQFWVESFTAVAVVAFALSLGLLAIGMRRLWTGSECPPHLTMGMAHAAPSSSRRSF